MIGKSTYLILRGDFMFLLGDLTNSVVMGAGYIILEQWLDFAIYALMSITFDVFFVIARLDIFGSTQMGQQIYDNFSQKIYMILAIVMVFVFAYNLLMYVMQPDGRFVSDKMKPTTILKRITFSMILIILTPLLFRYMSIFQNHVLVEDTIPSIILGKEAGHSKLMSRGKRISMMTYMTFFHPNPNNNPMGYNDFINDIDSDTCNGYFKDPETIQPDNKTTKAFARGLIANCESEGPFDNKELIKSAGFFKEDNLEKMPIVSSIAGIAIVFFAIGYVYSVAGRVFKLFALQIFAPIPIFMRIFNKEKNYDPWFKEIKDTYLDVFIRVGVISFILYICSMLPYIIQSIDDAVLSSLLMG